VPKAEKDQGPLDAAEAVEMLQEEEESAAEKRGRQAERAADRKGYPDDAGTPQQVKRGGDTAYAVQRLIDDGEGLLGHPPHVVAGAMYGVDKEYLTADEARKLVEQWLDSPADPVEAVEA
jgi:hypothetical protein